MNNKRLSASEIDKWLDDMDGATRGREFRERLAAQAKSPAAQRAVALSERDIRIHTQDCPKAWTFFTKHALGSIQYPSCLACGHPSLITGDGAIRHLELPDIYICEKCVTVLRAHPAPAGERNWTEDFSHENGNYQNKCVKCDQIFNGHKRRVVCKACTPAAPAAPNATPRVDANLCTQEERSGNFLRQMVPADFARQLERELTAVVAPAKVGMDEKTCPMQDGPPIPWALAEAIWQGYALCGGRDQPLERVAERGGFGWSEVAHIWKRTNVREAIRAHIAQGKGNDG